MTHKIIPTVLVGLGHVNRGWLTLIESKHEQLIHNYGLEFKVVAVADSSGIAVNSDGYSPAALLNLKKSGKHVKDLVGYLDGIGTEDIANHIPTGLLLESSPGNIHNGQPGLDAVRGALRKGIHVVMANKAPLIFAFDELHRLAVSSGAKLKFSATVCGGLPVVNVIQRDLKLASIKSVKGIFNATSNFILRELEHGGNMDAAVKEAQRIGAAEADPSHDIDGHDTANKLFIIMKSAGLFVGTIHDISVEGIGKVSPQDIRTAQQETKKIKLVAKAELLDGDWKLSVSPEKVEAHSFLGTCDGWEMGVQIESDFYEKVYLKNYEAEPTGTSAAVLRDAIDIVSRP